MRRLRSWIPWLAAAAVGVGLMAWSLIPDWMWRKAYVLNKDFTNWITASPPAVISLVAVLTSLIVLLTTLSFQKRFLQRASVLEMLKLWTQEPLKTSRRNGWDYLMTLGDADLIDMARLRSDSADDRKIAYEIGQVFEFFANLRHLVNSGHADGAYSACVFQHYWASWSDYLVRMLFEAPTDGPSVHCEELYNIKKWYREHVAPVGRDVFDEPANEFPNFQVVTADEERYWKEKADRRRARLEQVRHILNARAESFRREEPEIRTPSSR